MKPSTISGTTHGSRWGLLSLLSRAVLTAKGSEGEVFRNHSVGMVSSECCVCELFVVTRVGIATGGYWYEIMA